ncbi:hypothetical protein ACHAW5_003992 [Stephanodiscus triporus]|uniref:Uncharacterized protein n=1 Tax=Stephanodiscus triporus TaxID=2934178 RepID=A0ABD3MJG0_9STRA
MLRIICRFYSSPFRENYTTTDDKQSLWYTESELQSLINERDQNVRMLQRLSGADINDQTMIKYAQLRMHRANTTPMGLEDKVQDAMQNESTNRARITKSVLVSNGDGLEIKVYVFRIQLRMFL